MSIINNILIIIRLKLSYKIMFKDLKGKTKIQNVNPLDSCTKKTSYSCVVAVIKNLIQFGIQSEQNYNSLQR